ncbi:MAG: Lrp/AsnC family transcriptional regulator [Gammaproteobacteria bacterium]|nr:Lrp/AsnC family transcriptional regulator [Gammaproteobacteria bacterium]
METHHVELDKYDIRLLNALQGNARLTSQELAAVAHLSASQCNRRQRKLEKAGLIESYVAILDRERSGFGVLAIINLSLARQGQNPSEQFHQAVAGMPQVLECWAVTGDSDYVMKVVAADLRAFNRFLMQDLLALKVVTAVRTSILLQAIKQTTALPVDAGRT